MVSLLWVGLTLALHATGFSFSLRLRPAISSDPNVDPCPTRCSVAGPDPANWPVYQNFHQIQACQHTLFYQFTLSDPVDDPSTSHRIYACTSYGTDWATLPNSTVNAIPAQVVNVTYEIGWSSDSGGLAAAEIRILSKQMRQYLAKGYGATTRAAILFARLGKGTVGLYIGSALQNEGVGSAALQALESNLPLPGDISTASLGMQLCKPGDDGDHVFGFFAASNASYAPIQAAIKSWSNAECLSFQGTKNITGPAFVTLPAHGIAANSTNSSSTISTRGLRLRKLSPRSDCTTIQVASGDSCASLAVKCGISGAAFTQYNPSTTFCSTLQPLQHVCCSTGTLPDFSPKPHADGSCATYTVKTDDNCSGIAAANSLTVQQLETFNAKTWGWNGCSLVWIGTVICLSSGTPPMPAPISNAVCGPQVLGTVAPPAGTDISTLNPCPLNACCDVWGQCGTTAVFCTNTSTGAPGTAQPGTNGCISNCGTTIVRSSSPAVFRSVAYFEGYNLNRPCLYQDATQLDPTQYTHIHFAFAELTTDYQVTFGDVLTEYEFQNFQRIQGPAKILSIGGWDFSTSTATYNIFRQGVTAANRLVMASNIANFVKANGLDGVDIDWEYPAAPDKIGDIPAGDQDAGLNYMYFLIVLKNLLPGKSVSIAAPASYWYLKGFPIAQMSSFLDYIVFMTYDLHGQWDAGGQWNQDGCPSGSCLRSHVNLTETLNALTMITKAGVPSNKVVVGVASYGRSFAMANAGCYNQQCFFLGTNTQSFALPGPCTSTAGYISNAEIKAILNDASRVNQNYLDQQSHSNILVYDNVQWVGWMSPEVKSTRILLYKQLSMGGVSNWAADLEDYHDPPPPTASWDRVILDIKINIDPLELGGSRTGNWTSVKCDDPAMDIDEYTPSQRWSMMDGDNAWADLINQWKTVDKPQGLSFTESISNSVKGPEGADCGTFIKKSNCADTQRCVVYNNVGAAGTEIWNSLVIIHEIYDTYVDALNQAASEIIGFGLQRFMNTFAPVSPPLDNALLDFVIDLITLGTGAVAKPFFDWFVTSLPTFKFQSNIVDRKDDITDAFVSGATSLIQGGATGLWTPSDQAIFSDYLGHVLTGWSAEMEVAVAQLFGGRDESINVLTTLISNGNLLGGGQQNSSFRPSLTAPNQTQTALAEMAAKIFYAYAIPSAWNVTGQAAFVVDTGLPCDAVNPAADNLNNDVRDTTATCYYEHLYFIASPLGAARDCDGASDTAVVCRDNLFSAPPGVGALDGVAFEGVRVSDIVIGSLLTYIQNGRKNGGPLADVGNAATFDQISAANFTTPGFMRLPVCSPDVARRAWASATSALLKDPNYPCVTV